MKRELYSWQKHSLEGVMQSLELISPIADIKYYNLPVQKGFLVHANTGRVNAMYGPKKAVFETSEGDKLTDLILTDNEKELLAFTYQAYPHANNLGSTLTAGAIIGVAFGLLFL